MAHFLFLKLVHVKLGDLPIRLFLHLFDASIVFDIVKEIYKFRIKKLLAALNKVVKFRNLILQNFILDKHHL